MAGDVAQRDARNYYFWNHVYHKTIIKVVINLFIPPASCQFYNTDLSNRGDDLLCVEMHQSCQKRLGRNKSKIL